MVGRLELERRVLIAALTATCLAAVIWLVAISTTEWCSVKFDPWRFIPKTNLSIGGYSIGLWRMCGRLYFNNTADGPGRDRLVAFSAHRRIRDVSGIGDSRKCSTGKWKMTD